jgi:hypothetical protein
MNPVKVSVANASSKAATGIAGFDEITGGGLPRGRTTLFSKPLPGDIFEARYLMLPALARQTV